jgi:hypothetical protein
MEDPIKIIYKVKNNNRKNQYHIYIFLGNLVNQTIQKIIKKFTDFNLFDTLTSLNDKEIKELENKYGPKWYNFFFIHHHIDFTFDNIRKSKQKIDEIIDKLGIDWYNIHIKDYKISGKTSFNYASIVKRDRINKFSKTIKEGDKLDYRTEISKQFGGTKEKNINGKPRVFIYAKRSLKVGEELFYDYSLDIEGRVTKQMKKDYECRCGAKKCRGTMLAVED